MKSSHYPSLELCKKLTEIGFQKTDKCFFKGEYQDLHLEVEDYSGLQSPIILVPSIMEMLDIMPSTICNGYDYHMEMQKTRNGAYAFTYRCSGPDEDIIKCGTLPNALAEMCLYLHENGFVSFKKTI